MSASVTSRRVSVVGCGIDALTFNETVAEVDRIVRARRPVQHCAINAGKVVLMHKQPKLRAIVRECALANADGQSVVWASRFLGRPLPERVAGIDLFQALLALAADRGYAVYFLGATQEVLDASVARARLEHPTLSVCGARNGYWAEGDGNVVEGIRKSKPEILFVGLPSPRKEYWLAEHLDRLQVPFAMGVGGTFDVYAGHVRRAPRWMQRAGLEWAFRFYQEPGRMWRRYLLGNLEFLLLVLKYWRARGSSAEASGAERLGGIGRAVKLVTAKIMYVVGARPNFVKVAPVIAAAEAWNKGPGGRQVRFERVLVHTGQHYDPLLSEVFFEQLAMPDPDEYLGVGSGSQAQQTARVLEALEPVLLQHRPDVVLVPGDVNSTCAGALAAAKLTMPVVHLEAGLRSHDRTMPEEINRIVADHVSDLLLTTCADADANLLHEGVPRERIVRVGNTMIDSLERLRAFAETTVSATRARLGMRAGAFVLATLHRPSNVDSREQLGRLLDVLAELSKDLTVVLPLHPRTRARLGDGRSACRVSGSGSGLLLVDPLGYLEFLGLMTCAAAVITDSGGVQEETTALGVPCVTVRTTTERPITIAEGTNRMVDPADAAAIFAVSREAVAEGIRVPAPRLDMWDGRAGERVVQALARWVIERAES